MAPADGARVLGVLREVRAVGKEAQAAGCPSQAEYQAAAAVGEAGVLHGNVGGNHLVASAAIGQAGHPRLPGRHLGNDDVDRLLGNHARAPRQAVVGVVTGRVVRWSGSMWRVTTRKTSLVVILRVICWTGGSIPGSRW